MNDPQMCYAAICSFGEIGRNGRLIMDDEVLNKSIEILHHKLLTTNETNKVKEKSAFTFGYICVGDREFKLTKKIMDILLNSAQAKQIELHMAFGESLLNCALGTNSSASRNTWTCREEDWNRKIENEEQLKWLLDELLNKYIENGNPFFTTSSLVLATCFAKKVFKYK